MVIIDVNYFKPM